jgi:hypothetical protein
MQREQNGSFGMQRWLKVVTAALALAAAMPAAQAGRAAATMEVSFRIVEACTVRTSQASGQDAEVRCQYQTPYQLQTGQAPRRRAATSARSIPTRRPPSPSGSERLSLQKYSVAVTVSL